jgi:hypothetical protein
MVLVEELRLRKLLVIILVSHVDRAAKPLFAGPLCDGCCLGA